MSAYYPDEYPSRERSRRTYYREERRDERDPRYVDPRDNYLSATSRDLVPRPREDSDLSVEEVQRDFPPPGYARDIRRARSAEAYDGYDDRRSYYSRDDRDYDRDYGRRSRKAPTSYAEDEDRKRARMFDKQEQIIAALAGAAVAIGGKELYDRREAKQEGSDVHRNLLASAALGAAGAFAGYQGAEYYTKHHKKSSSVARRGRDGQPYYSDDDDDSKEKTGHKNFLEGALAAAGLGGAVKALTGAGGHDERAPDARSRRGSDASSKSKGRGEGASRVQKAAMASLIAGATEAFRVSKEPGGWKGEKAKRVLTAAAGAATIDAAQNPDKSGKLGIAEAVIGGLVGNRVINGSRKNIEEDGRTGRSRSRSRVRSEGGNGSGATGLAALATAGLGALGAKKIMDRSQSRHRSADSYDSRASSPGNKRRHRSRSRSVVDSARRSLAKMGIGNGPDDDYERDRPRDRGYYDDDDEPRGPRRHRKYDYDDDYDDYPRGEHGRDRGGRGRDYDDDRTAEGREGTRPRQRGGPKRRDSSRSSSKSASDLGDSDSDSRREKKLRGKTLITTGLAAVATIHAAHNVYQSMEKRKARQKAVKEGTISPEEARKRRQRALLQDAASVGLAALGVKGAVSEIKEVREQQQEWRQWKDQRAARHQRRLERQARTSNGGDGRRRADNWSSAAPPRADRSAEGPRYTDGNPYSALPAPPVGYPDRR